MINTEICGECPNMYLGCDEHLMPKGIGDRTPKQYLGCRHLTCDLGIAYAVRAVRAEIRYNGILSHPVSFGTSHIPIGTRYVDIDGRIYSEQDGSYYPTGQ